MPAFNAACVGYQLAPAATTNPRLAGGREGGLALPSDTPQRTSASLPTVNSIVGCRLVTEGCLMVVLQKCLGPPAAPSCRLRARPGHPWLLQGRRIAPSFLLAAFEKHNRHRLDSAAVHHLPE
jgi:hypothetical protein